MGGDDLNKARKKRLDDNAVEFRNKVIPSELLPHLTCLTDGTKEKIIQKEVNNGPMSAALQLIMVVRKNDDWFEQLIPALRQIGQNKLADLLDDPEVDHCVQRPGVRQNGPQPDPSFNPINDRQTVDKGKGATFSPHRPRNQGASRYPPYQNEEQAIARRGERVTGDTLYRQLPATVMDVLRLLDEPSISGKDWQGLAGCLGYTIDIVERLKLRESPTEALLLEWGFGEKATLNSLLKALHAIGRVDVYQQLQDVLGFHIEGFDQIPRPKSPPQVPSVVNLPKLDCAWDDSEEAKVEIKKQPRKRNDKPRDSSSEANRAGETISDGNKRNAGNSGLDITNTGSSGQVEAKEVNKECPVKDQVGTGQSSGCSEAPGATTCADEPITNRDETKSMTRSKTDTSDQDIAPESKSTTSEGGSIMNNLNRNPHAMKQNISIDQRESALEPKPQNNQQYVKENLRESDQQSSNITMSNGTKMVAGNNASSNYNLDRGGQAADQRFSDPVDENCRGKTLLSQTSRASTTSSLNDDMDTMYSATGPDDCYRSLRNPDSLDATIGELLISDASFPSIGATTCAGKPITNRDETKSETRSKDDKEPESKSATPDFTASSTHQVISTPDTRGSESPHNTTLVPKPDRVQKSMKGTPVTQPAHVPADVPGGLGMPSADPTFSKDSLMAAITPGRMLRESQTASTQEAEGKVLGAKQPASGIQDDPHKTKQNLPLTNISTNSTPASQQLDAKQPASGIQDDPHNTRQNLPSTNISTNSTPASPLHEKDVTNDQKQSMSEDDPSLELQESILEPQENADPVPPEIDEPQGTSVVGSFLRVVPALLSFASSVQNGDFAPYKN